MRPVRGTVLLAGLAVAVVVACGGGNGAAGPLGPQPQSKASAWPFTEVWRTPHPIPFGTAGLTGIPPRPTFVARLAHPTSPMHTQSPSPGTAWETPALADAGLAAYRPVIPADAQERSRYQVSAPASPQCAMVVRDAGVSDVEAFYAEARRALLAAGFVVQFEVDREHDGPFDVVLRAYSPAAKAEISTGSAQVAPIGPSLGHRYVVRVEFTQRCA